MDVGEIKVRAAACGCVLCFVCGGVIDRFTAEHHRCSQHDRPCWTKPWPRGAADPPWSQHFDVEYRPPVGSGAIGPPNVGTAINYRPTISFEV